MFAGTSFEGLDIRSASDRKLLSSLLDNETLDSLPIVLPDHRKSVSGYHDTELPSKPSFFVTLTSSFSPIPRKLMSFHFTWRQVHTSNYKNTKTRSISNRPTPPTTSGSSSDAITDTSGVSDDDGNSCPVICNETPPSTATTVRAVRLRNKPHVTSACHFSISNLNGVLGFNPSTRSKNKGFDLPSELVDVVAWYLFTAMVTGMALVLNTFAHKTKLKVANNSRISIAFAIILHNTHPVRRPKAGNQGKMHELSELPFESKNSKKRK